MGGRYRSSYISIMVGPSPPSTTRFFKTLRPLPPINGEKGINYRPNNLSTSARVGLAVCVPSFVVVSAPTAQANSSAAS